MIYQDYLREMLSVMLCWNDYNIYYLAKRLSISHVTLCRGLKGQLISKQSAHRIICYYFAHRSSAKHTDEHSPPS